MWEASMKTWLAVGVLGLLVLSGTARAQTSGSVNGTTGQNPAAETVKPDEAAQKKTLQTLYDKCVTATKKHDESVLAGLRAKDFIYKEANGKTYTRDQVETSERHAMSQVATIESIGSSVDSVKPETGKTTATVRQSFSGTILDAQNKTHKITMALTTRDTWLPVKDGWKLQSVQVVSQQETRDGRPFNPDAAVQNAVNRGQNGSASNRSTGNYGGNGYRSSGYRAPVIHVPHISVPHVHGTHRHTKKA
jgi:hypothetical protein